MKHLQLNRSAIVLMMLVAVSARAYTSNIIKVRLQQCSQPPTSVHFVWEGQDDRYIPLDPKGSNTWVGDLFEFANAKGEKYEMINIDGTPASLRLEGFRTDCVHSFGGTHDGERAALFTFQCDQQKAWRALKIETTSTRQYIYLRLVPAKGPKPCHETAPLSDEAIVDLRFSKTWGREVGSFEQLYLMFRIEARDEKCAALLISDPQIYALVAKKKPITKKQFQDLVQQQRDKGGCRPLQFSPDEIELDAIDLEGFTSMKIEAKP